FYFLLIRPQQKRIKEQKAFVDNLEKGADVVTNGGILGRIVGVTDTVFTLEIGDKVKIKVLKSAVSRLQKDSANN
ncbi:preprotein translocase subunit YajC, partial [Thermodesulfobacteriota bacterium]